MKEHRAALKRARRERKLLKKRSPMITHLERELGDLSAVDAVNILCEEFNFGQAQVKFLSGRETTVNNLKAIIAGHNMGAELVGPLMFFGGPPNNAATLYQGSLFTMVMDKILYEYSINGSYADLVH